MSGEGLVAYNKSNFLGRKQAKIDLPTDSGLQMRGGKVIEAAVNARNVPVRSSHIIRSQTHIDVSLIGETPLRTKNS